MHSAARRQLGIWLTIVFFVAMFMGAGPGILLANRPALWWGMPQLYVWGLFWCFVEATVVTVAYFTVWRD